MPEGLAESRISFSKESVSNALTLAREIKPLIGNTTDSSAEQTRIFLSKIYPGTEYKSLRQILTIASGDTNAGDDAVIRAKNAVDMVGAAALIAGGDKILAWAAEGKICENLPEDLQGIDEIINKNLFVRDENDKVGKFIVSKLNEAEKVNKKAQRAPNIYGGKVQEEGLREVADQLMDERDELPEDSEDALKVDAVVGYLDSTISKKNGHSDSNKKDRKEDYEGISPEIQEALKKYKVSTEAYKKAINGDFSELPPRLVVGENGELTQEGREFAWMICEDKMVEAISCMAADLRWPTWTPPEWIKKYSKEIQNRIEVMVMINDGAAYMIRAGKDIDKIRNNPYYFMFTQEYLSLLYNDDFKVAMSKLIHDLCEKYIDDSGNESLRYKEVPNKKGGYGIDEDVMDKITHHRSYSYEIAKVLAEKNGHYKTDEKGNKVIEPDFMDKMTAYTAWNFFYLMGDSSVCDRMRVLPTFGGVVIDALRTLNIESKGLAKPLVIKGEAIPEDEETYFGSEWFGGYARYLQVINQAEKDLGHPLDGEKYLKDKIKDGSLPVYRYKMCYGFNDFIYNRYLHSTVEKDEKGHPLSYEKIRKNAVDALYKLVFEEDKDKIKQFKNKLFKGESTIEGLVHDYIGSDGSEKQRVIELGNIIKKSEKTLTQVLWDYASFDKDGKLVGKQGEDFTFGDQEVDFWNLFRDMQEGAAIASSCFTGKADIKDFIDFATSIRDKIGMVRSISKNNLPMFSYMKKYNFWGDIIALSNGVDMKRLSTNCIYVKMPKGLNEEVGYNLWLEGLLTEELNLSNFDTNKNEILRYLGVNVNLGEDPVSFPITVKTQVERARVKRKVSRLYDSIRDINTDKYDINKLEYASRMQSSTNREIRRLAADLKISVKSGDSLTSRNVIEAMERILSEEKAKV